MLSVNKPLEPFDPLEPRQPAAPVEPFEPIEVPDAPAPVNPLEPVTTKPTPVTTPSRPTPSVIAPTQSIIGANTRLESTDHTRPMPAVQVIAEGVPRGIGRRTLASRYAPRPSGSAGPGTLPQRIA